MQKKKQTNVMTLVFMLLFLLAFLIIMGRYMYIQMTGEANKVSLTEWANELRETSITLSAERGKIYDNNGMMLAYNRPTYRVYAILDPEYTVNPDEPMHIIDAEKTAEQLSAVINIDKKEIVEKIKSGQKEERFQVEFGKEGKNLPQEVMEKIAEQEIPGINFIEDSMRYYPNGMFASHILGFARNDDKDELIGIAGIENEKDEILGGTDGYIRYKRDKYDKKLLNADEVVKSPENGDDIYLTIDQKIQTLLEDVMSQVDEQYSPKRITAVVMNPKTGEVLAMSNRPSYNPNKPEDIKNWYNDVISTPVEPGSTIKMFTWSAAIEEGVYKGSDTFQSGKYSINPKVETINDHNQGKGWGKIDFDEGFRRSSNVAASKLVWENMGTDEFLEYIKAFDFDEPTNIDLPSEVAGKVLYDWPSEKLRAAFGQGSTVTPIQQMKAATAIVNGGDMMQPYIIDKIIDSNTGKVIEEKSPQIVGTPISESTADQMMDLLDSAVNQDDGTGKPYRLDNYSVIGKTGTAQIPNPEGSGYLPGNENNIFSFLGMAPKENPQILMHVSVTQPELKDDARGSDPVSFIFNNVMENGLHYLNIEPDKDKVIDPIESNEFPSIEGKNTKDIKKQLEESKLEVVFVGDGKKVVAASVEEGIEIFPSQKVIIVTDKATMPNIKGWSERDVLSLASLLELDVEIKGSGFVTNQSIKKDTKIKGNMKLGVTLGSSANKEEKEKEKSKK